MDASGSIAATIAEIEPLLAEPAGSGTLVLRAEIHGGFMELGEGILGSSLGHVLRGLSARRCVVVTSGRSRERAETAAEHVRSGAGLPADVVELPEGERSKLMEQQEILFRNLAGLRLERQDPLVAVGDDVLLEATTFAAAVYLRGVPLVTIPVTTLGLIDTSIGGKGGVDLPGLGRNLLGAIHQPKATILDIDLVRDEPVIDRRAALAEAIKYGLIGDDRAPVAPRSRRSAGRQPALAGGPRVAGDRRALRAGKATPGALRRTGHRRRQDGAQPRAHAQSCAGSRDGVSGSPRRGGRPMAFVPRSRSGCRWASRRPRLANRASRLMRRLGLAQAPLDVPITEVLTYIESDKKRRGGRPRWVLVGTNGVTIRDDVPAATVRDAVSMALAGATGDSDRGHSSSS